MRFGLLAERLFWESDDFTTMASLLQQQGLAEWWERNRPES